MACLQLRVQKHILPITGAIVFIWLALPAFEITMAILSTDIVKGTCVPWGSFSNYAMEKTISSLVFVVAYLLPLMAMVFCYSRIVYTLMNKVTSSSMSVLRKMYICAPKLTEMQR